MALARQPLAQGVERDGGARQIDHHDHGEEFADHRLADVQNVDVGIGEHVRNAGNDADAVGADNGDDGAARLRGPGFLRLVRHHVQLFKAMFAEPIAIRAVQGYRRHNPPVAAA